MRSRLSTWELLAVLCVSAPASAQITVDARLPSYKAVDGVSGRITSVGSDTMHNLMAMWAQEFRKIYPKVEIEIEGKGSNTAPAALISGRASFGPMIWEMKKKDLDAFRKEYGYAPTGLVSGIDLLSVFVHKDNPIKGLTLAQLDAVCSKTRKAGYNQVYAWGDLGLDGEWAKKPISIYGRNSVSYSYGHLKERVLRNGEFKEEVKEQLGDAALIQGVSRDKFAIGYAPFTSKTPRVRVVPLATMAGGALVTPDPEKARSGEYPLARFQYLYVNYKPGAKLDPLRLEFLRYVFSKEGQLDVIRSGFIPVTAEDARKVLLSVGIE